MNLVLLVLVTTLIACQAADTSPKASTTPESLNVANNFRKALLEALEQLESEEPPQNTTTSNLGKEDLDISDFDEENRQTFGRKIREKISKQEATVTSFSDGGKASVFVHSFSANPNNKPATEKSSTRNVPVDNVISASVTSSVDNKLFSTSTGKSSGSVLPTPTAPVTQKSALTSPNPTVSTPVEEDETKAKVEDVQFIHAPLVAAFTVQQDDKGLPQKVIPIFGNKQAQTSSNSFQQQGGGNTVNQYQATLEQKQRSLEQQIRVLQEQRRQQELLLQQQQQLQALTAQRIQEQRQRQILEEQQNRLGSGLTAQRQVDDQPNRFSIPLSTQSDPNSFKPISPITNDQSSTVVSLQPSITVQPSVSFQPNFNRGSNPNPSNQFNSQLSFTSQGLPIKSAINFQKSVSLPISQQINGFTQHQLPLTQQYNVLSQQPNVLTQQSNSFTQQFNGLSQQQVPQQYRQNVFNQDNYLQDFFYRQRTLVPPPRGNRVFRQESQSQVGNFGINDFSQSHYQQQRFNSINSQKFNGNENSFRYNPNHGFDTNFRTNFHVNNNRQVIPNYFNNNQNFQQTTVDNRLKNLIYQSGLGQGRGQEDLNIVSKVLALDHTGNNYQNLLFGASNVVEKRVPLHYSKTFKT